jgi:hypothetical protein
MNNIRINNRANVSLSAALDLVGAVIDLQKEQICGQTVGIRYENILYIIEVKVLKNCISYTIYKQKTDN